MSIVLNETIKSADLVLRERAQYESLSKEERHAIWDEEPDYALKGIVWSG
jgi:hypothetical protein